LTNNTNGKFTTEEIMAVTISHSLKNGERGYTGLPTGARTNELAISVPLVGMALAKLTHAPDFLPMLAGWVVDPDWNEFPSVPLVGEYEDRILTMRSVIQLTEEEHWTEVRQGYVDVGFITAAQIDKYGNINIVSIGDYHKPKVRFVGPIFLQQHMALFQREVIVMRLEKKRFVDRVDFISAVGYLEGPGTREKAGLKRGGPYLVVTDKGIMDFDPNTKRMRLKSVHPGVSVEEVLQNVGFDLIIPGKIPETTVPTDKEVQLIREKIDPHAVLLHR
jgi:glutaconate CoA-transferase subunit B